jgi:hypothetical protein
MDRSVRDSSYSWIFGTGSVGVWVPAGSGHQTEDRGGKP